MNADKDFNYTVKIINAKEVYVGIGIKSFIEKNDYNFDFSNIWHGCFTMSNQGYFYFNAYRFKSIFSRPDYKNNRDEKSLFINFLYIIELIFKTNLIGICSMILIKILTINKYH